MGQGDFTGLNPIGSLDRVNIQSWLRNLANNDVAIYTIDAAPVNGSSGTGAGLLGPGALLIRTDTVTLYMNTNTKASPTWTALGSASGQVLVSPSISGTVSGGATYTAPTLNSPIISTLKSNFSTATVAAGFATDTYLAGSAIGIPTGGFLAGARYSCKFDMVKTAAGTATIIVILRIGTLGTTGDAAILTFTFAAGTAAIDAGTFEVNAHFRTVGSGTSAVLVGEITCDHALAATGLISTGASGNGQLVVVSAGFDSTIANTIIGVSFNGGASFSGTNTIVESELRSY